MTVEVPKISKGFTLYTAGSPNGWKIGILLRETGLPCEVKAVDLAAMEQKEPWFLKLNLNGRIPLLVDHDNDDFTVMESGAIMMYLADKAGTFYPTDWIKRSEVQQWLFFMNAGLGPMQGTAHHFIKMKQKIPYAQQRYIKEVYRLYSVLEERLKDHEWLAADEYTIADMAVFPWVYYSPHDGLALEDYPNLKKWAERVHARPATKEGLDMPYEGPAFLKEAWTDEEARQAMIKERQQAHWVGELQV